MPEPSLDLLQRMVQQVLDGQVMLREDNQNIRQRLDRIERALLSLQRNLTTALSMRKLAIVAILLLAASPAFAADKSVRSRPNSQGGETYYSTGKHPVQCRPNSQGGQTCHSI